MLITVSGNKERFFYVEARTSALAGSKKHGKQQREFI